jgi:hypothetical protein
MEQADEVLPQASVTVNVYVLLLLHPLLVTAPAVVLIVPPPQLSVKVTWGGPNAVGIISGMPSPFASVGLHPKSIGEVVHIIVGAVTSVTFIV